MVDRAAALHLVGDQHIALVEEEDAELFAGLVRHGGVAVLNDRGPGGEHLLASDLAFQRPVGNRRDQFQVEGYILADALHLGQQTRRRAKNAGKRAEPINQRLGDRFGVAPRDQAEKQEFEDFVVGKRRVALFAKAVTQPLAVTVVMFRSGE
ncbi:hypothetical protein AMC83_CH01969 [Rhizobium phaseoli]|nr:hypothetical protein AMC83_CH01969 [Rhizobium phaseoli]